nr:DUF1080 domain-containing protein [Allomuricauda sp.]
MRNNIFLVVFFIVFFSCKQKGTSLKEEVKEEMGIKEPSGGQLALFNGTNLDNWYFTTRDTTYSGNITDIFALENGLIHVLGKPDDLSTQTFAGITTRESYSNYRLTLDYKWGEKKFKPRHEFVRDAGVLFHVHGDDTVWPKSVECQIQEGDTGDIWAIGTQVTSTVNPVIRNYSPEGDSITRGGEGIRFSRFHRGYDWERPHGQWNHLEIVVKGKDAKYSLNGYVVNEALDMKYWDEETGQMEPLTEGKILLQAEGAEIYYRNIFLELLE